MPIQYGVPDEETETRTGTATASNWARTSDVENRGAKYAPTGPRGQRLSPTLDPVARMKISNTAKWILLMGILLFIAWIPAQKWPQTSEGARDPFWLLADPVIVAFSVIVATGLPRTLMPQIFGKWHEAVDACRDWLVVGLTTGALMGVGVNLIRASTSDHNSPIYKGDTTDAWLRYRLPLIVVCAIVGLLLSHVITIRREGVLNKKAGGVFVPILVQALLVSALVKPFQDGILNLCRIDHVANILAIAAGVCAVIAFGILVWAYMADSKLMALQKGVVSGNGPVELTLTVVGGKEAGKTVLLAAAFWEWSSSNIGNLRVKSSDGAGVSGGDGTDLPKVANDLYVNRAFPAPTTVCKNLPFDLYLGPDKVARFNFLDYPGGAFTGRVDMQGLVDDFYRQVDDTDGVLLVADMSFVRRGKKDDDWLEVQTAYRNVLQRLIDRNGANRVIPVALILTKCDEYVDHQTGRLRMTDLEEGLRFFKYFELQDEWQQLCRQHGPGFAEFTIWFTSAITYSRPQHLNDDPSQPFDETKKYQPVEPPEPIEPSGCAAPMLWLSAKVLRWNVTMFRDLSSFIFGSSPKVRRRMDAILELERIANERATRVKS